MSRKPRSTRPPRMGSLARLPVFFDLTDKRVVVAGGTQAAAWKVELLLASGARVELYARDIEPDMQALLSDPDNQNRLTHYARPWAIDSFEGSSFALADAANDDEARAFSCAARAAGVPFNVIDRPRYCQVQFGSIVNRSPVVIGISTAGAAPILGQAIRRKIETLIPTSLTAWAEAANRLRATVMQRLPMGGRRRAFWERLAELSFTQPAHAAENATFDSVYGTIDEANQSGKVTLVGAGPGDPDLLTMKAIRALQSADIILFDDLVADGVLELARREARRMMVGKRGGKASCRQDDINALMVKLAHQGKHVVRLKAGDPMVFGRAGEEIATLQAEGIAVSVVPGVTAASALAAEANISLTHRDCAQSVSFVTGHAKNGALPSTLNLDAMSKPGASHVVYMGSRTAAQLQADLLARGASDTLPVLVAQSVSRPDQVLLPSTLAGLSQAVSALPGDGPVLIALGEAFADARIATTAHTAPLASGVAHEAEAHEAEMRRVGGLGA